MLYTLRFSAAFTIMLSMIVFACQNDEETSLPVVTTGELIITSSKTILQGSIHNINGRELQDHGFVWANYESPSIERGFIKSLGKLFIDGSFIAELNAAFAPGKPLYVRAFFTLSGQTFYSEQVKFDKVSQKMPVIQFFGPERASWGDTLTIVGKNFSLLPEDNRISFGDHAATCISAGEDTLKAIVPGSLDLASVPLTLLVYNLQTSSSSPFKLHIPTIQSFTPASGRADTTVTISGNYYKADLTKVYFNTLMAEPVSVASNKIVVKVPPGLPDGDINLSVEVAGQSVNAGASFTHHAMSITSVAPLLGTFDDEIIIQGTGFPAVISATKVYFGETEATVKEASARQLKVVVPRALKKSSVQLKVMAGNEFAASAEYFELESPVISSFSPESGTFGDVITINGRNFNPAGTVVTLGGAVASVLEASESQLKVSVPNGFSSATGISKLVLRVADIIRNSDQDFTLGLHTISAVSPSTATRQSIISLSGTHFNPDPQHTEVYFGSIRTKIIQASTTDLDCVIPGALGRGTYPVTVRCGGRDVISTQTITLDDPWAVMAPIGGGPRKHAFAFVIEGKAYVGGGFGPGNPGSYRNDLYRFDPQANTWTRMRDVPVNARGMVSFVAGKKAYVVVDKEVWQYDPEINEWTRKRDFPGEATREQAAFTIGNRSFLGCGITKWGGSVEFYEYSELNDSWTPRSNDSRFLMGFAIGDYGYVQRGAFAREIWKYDPTTGAWTQACSLLGVVDGVNRTRQRAVGISGGGKGYLATGTDDELAWGELYKDLYEFDPGTNSVTKLPDIPGPPREYAFGFYIDGKVYVGGGQGSDANGFLLTFDDLYEYSIDP